ncbi:MAG: GspH/FimT family protein [Gammaproteobacteria bacterium]|jgi:prepilin-type N-terminal cleavage/methylation domain-containing protein
MQDGFTFLELIIVLLLIALLALFAVPQYREFLDRHHAQGEVEQIVRAITLARQQALLMRETITVYPNDTWSAGFILQDKSHELISLIEFHHQAHIFLKTFPAGSENMIQFSASGMTKTQNGSFYYCPQNINYAKRIVFNQAGRVYVTTDEAQPMCLETPQESL